MIVDILIKNGEVVGLVDSQHIAGERYAYRYYGIAQSENFSAGQNAIKNFYEKNPDISHYHYYGKPVGLSLETSGSAESAMQVWQKVRECIREKKLHAFTLPRNT